jgi:hypothetical protein
VEQKRPFALRILPRQGEVAPKATEGEGGDQRSIISQHSSAVATISRTMPSTFDVTSIAE